MTDSEKLDLLIVQMQAMNGEWTAKKSVRTTFTIPNSIPHNYIVYHTECKADGIQGLHSFC